MGNYSSPTTKLEIRPMDSTYEGAWCEHCRKPIKIGARIIVLLGHDHELDLGFSIGYCSLGCLQEDFAVMKQVDRERPNCFGFQSPFGHCRECFHLEDCIKMVARNKKTQCPHPGTFRGHRCEVCGKVAS